MKCYTIFLNRSLTDNNTCTCLYLKLLSTLCIIDDVCSFSLLNYSIHSKEAITLIIAHIAGIGGQNVSVLSFSILNLTLIYFTYLFWILEIESKSRPLSAKSLLSHDNFSSQPLTLVSKRLQSKGGALYCDLLSGPTAEGSRENKVLSPGKWGSL